MSFLTSTWSYLPFANFKVEPALLEPYLPKGTELDLRGACADISLVGLRFENTRILNLPVPFHINFSEINLRFYVRQPGSNRRGVVFIKEIVDKPLITLVANKLYNERYETMPLDFALKENDQSNKVTYRWKPKEWQQLSASYLPKALPIEQGSNEQFILERYYGYSSYDAQTTYEYEVCHASWKHYKVTDFELSVNFEQTYGSAFAVLDTLQPDSVMMAHGSRISIENKRKL
ncbi:hypothetical protein SAMN05192588_1976 [Nonlabens sp. Hel1_33_55]|uniref:YqjF family protein n=1 Tax=Nonlabens sp. Hel1_33_55 TaxID=1336802 RepID=UPI000875C0D4|nr:DUF2071 domain-containing protein [Nonlabens sp. Hel1_33_55]SCY27097.1 hypothetical protein SAMN05192588_1976 [Nonlabens sp. Hel1_33_55]